jgi:type II secretion system protein H
MILRTGQRRSECAFTMIELIVVMAILVIVLSVTFPMLQEFFRGRTLESEGRRFLALTRYGQSRAVSEGIPMTLWIDAKKGTYGLEAQTGYLDRDDRAKEYVLDDKLDFEVTQANRSTMTLEQQQRRRNALRNTRNSNYEIHFTPDGSVDLSSPDTITIKRDKKDQLRISQSESGLFYEVEP